MLAIGFEFSTVWRHSITFFLFAVAFSFFPSSISIQTVICAGIFVRFPVVGLYVDFVLPFFPRGIFLSISDNFVSNHTNQRTNHPPFHLPAGFFLGTYRYMGQLLCDLCKWPVNPHDAHFAAWHFLRSHFHVNDSTLTWRVYYFRTTIKTM